MEITEQMILGFQAKLAVLESKQAEQSAALQVSDAKANERWNRYSDAHVALDRKVDEQHNKISDRLHSVETELASQATNIAVLRNTIVIYATVGGSLSGIITAIISALVIRFITTPH